MSKLKRYQSIKQVHAEPMTFGTFNTTVRKIDPGKTMDQDTPGYHVIYSKGTQDEYHSWSPKAVFDEGYLELDDATAPVPQTGKVS